MKTFHNDISVKEKYLSRVQSHRLADEIVKGTYWEAGKGCAVGCTIHSGNHSAYESELGIPEWLAKVKERIFEGLPNKRALMWPEEFLSAIPLGVDLEQVRAPFLVYILESALKSFDHEKFPKVKEAIERVKSLWQKRETNIEVWREARSAADAAYTPNAAYAATAADAAYATAAYAAYAAIAAAEAAAYAAIAAAAAAAAGAAYATAAAYADKTIRAAKFEEFADKLLELLKAAV